MTDTPQQSEPLSKKAVKVVENYDLGDIDHTMLDLYLTIAREGTFAPDFDPQVAEGIFLSLAFASRSLYIGRANDERTITDNQRWAFRDAMVDVFALLPQDSRDRAISKLREFDFPKLADVFQGHDLQEQVGELIKN